MSTSASVEALCAKTNVTEPDGEELRCGGGEREGGEVGGGT